MFLNKIFWSFLKQVPKVSNFPSHTKKDFFSHPIFLLIILNSGSISTRVFFFGGGAEISMIFLAILFSKIFNYYCHWWYTHRQHSLSLSPPNPAPTHTHTHTERLHSTVCTKGIGGLRKGFSYWGGSDDGMVESVGECGLSSGQVIWKIMFLFERKRMFQWGEKLPISNYIFIIDIKKMTLRSGCLELMAAFILR